MYQLREDGDSRWLFIVYGRKKARFDIEGQSTMIIRMHGKYDAMLYHPMTGEITPLQCTYEKGETVIRHNYCIIDGTLIRFVPHGQGMCPEESCVENEEMQPVPAVWKYPMEPVNIELDEPNVYVLDMAQYAVDEEPFAEKEEVLRIGTAMREKYGITPQSGKMAQPWIQEKSEPEHILKLKYTVHSEIEVPQPLLALEHAARTKILFNGKPVESKIAGYYVDEKIQTVELPTIQKGENILLLEMPFGEGTDVENAFLLGDFGVKVKGAQLTVTEPVRTLAFGDITHQGLPFYGGNVTYKLEIEAENQITVRTPYYKGSLVGVSIDGERCGSIVVPPYRFEKRIGGGRHLLELTLFGNRINTFGCLHNCNENCTWFGPDAWRTKGDGYSYEYQLHRVGILKAPEIK